MNKVQSKIKENGNMMELKAMEILTNKFNNVDYVNELIDFYVENKIPIEIKSCQYHIKSSNSKYPLRLGRFVLDKEQHEFLEIHKGYYLFMVHHNGFLIKGKLIQAVDIPFSKLITWRELLERPNFTLEQLEVYLNDK